MDQLHQLASIVPRLLRYFQSIFKIMYGELDAHHKKITEKNAGEKSKLMLTAHMVSREEYEQLQADLNASQSKVSELEQQVNALTEALRLAQHKRFGASSEKTVDDGSQQLSFLFNEAEVISDHEAAQDKQETLVAAHKRHKKHEYTLDNLPEGVATEVVEHHVPQEELECPICGETIPSTGSTRGPAAFCASRGMRTRSDC